MVHQAERLSKLDEIESEMKALGSWNENPPGSARPQLRSRFDRAVDRAAGF
jgi:hypothetical protein